MTEETAVVVANEKETDRPFENDFDVSRLLDTVGKLEPDKAQTEILFAPVDPGDILIRPDGQVYLDWQWYAGRMSAAFPLRWALIPQGMPKINGNLIVWGFWLVIDGHLMGFSIGEQSRANERMTYAECCEGAKSNALMRLCKGLGMARSLWHRPFLDKWIAENAEQYRNERDKLVWRRKKPSNIETSGPDSGEAPESDNNAKPVEADKRTITNWAGKDVVADEAVGKTIAASAKWAKVFIDKFDHPAHYKNHLRSHFKVDSGGDLTWEQANALHDHLYNQIDDPRWYGEPVIVGDLQKLYVDKGLESLYSELRGHVNGMGFVQNEENVKHLAKVLADILEAVLVGTYQNPPSPDDVADMKDTLSKELKLG